MREAMTAGMVTFAGNNGEQIGGYLATPTGDAPRGGVLVIHHMPGFDSASLEITRRFAALGYHALCPNLFHRFGPDVDPDDSAAAARAQGGKPDAEFIGDAAGAVAHLRSLPSSNGKVGSIGYCSGCRQSVLAACTVDIDAAVDCYGAFVVGERPAYFPITVTPLYDLLPDLRCPLLGLFGAEDSYPTPEHVAELAGLLTAHGKEHEFHSYPGAGHAFFAVDRPAYRVAAAVDGWAKIEAFFGRLLSV